MNNDFHNKLASFVNDNSTKNASRLLMYELGTILSKSKQDFVDLLNESSVYANEKMSNQELVNLFVDNIDINEKLRLGSALLVNMHNKSVGFDGEDEISDAGVKSSYSILESHFSGDDEEFENAEGDEDYEEQSEFGNGGMMNAISGIIKTGGDVAGKAMDNQSNKKNGATNMAQKKQEAKAQMQQALLAQQRAKQEAQAKDKEASAKTTRTVLIVSGIVVGLAILGFVVYKIKKSKGK
jgi:hypothetical protein